MRCWNSFMFGHEIGMAEVVAVCAERPEDSDLFGTLHQEVWMA